jgi:carboxymethylenebutenolidase
VTITTPDGVADALLFAPLGSAPAPAVILWTDVGGLRPAIGEIGSRLAAEGYVVLAPNAFYRSVKLDGTSVSDVDARTRFTEWRGKATKEAISRDAKAYAAFLDGLSQVDHAAKVGTLGYDAGASYAFFTAQALPDRVAAVAIFHPAGTATARDNSPHLFVKESRAAYYVALASDDDQREPEDKGQYREEFAKAGLTATVVVLGGKHGFALPDNAAHDAASDAESWRAALALLKSALR